MTATAAGIDTVFCQVGGCDWWCEGDADVRAEASEAHRSEEHPWVRAGSCFRLASASGSDEGRAALDAMDAMDAGEPQTPALPAGVPVLPPPVLVTVAAGRRRSWTRASVEEALRGFRSAHGREPGHTDLKSPLPSAGTAARAFGVKNYGDVCVALGWGRPTTGTRRQGVAPRRVVRPVKRAGEPKGREAGAVLSPPPPAEPEPAGTGVDGEAVANDPPGPAPTEAEAGSPAEPSADDLGASFVAAAAEFASAFLANQAANDRFAAASNALTKHPFCLWLSAEYGADWLGTYPNEIEAAHQ